MSESPPAEAKRQVVRDEDLAEAVNRLFADRSRAREMGAAGRPRVTGIGWDAVVDALTEPLR